MTIEDFRGYMSVLATKQSPDVITFRGGDPFLFFKTLKRCIGIAHNLGQKKIEVLTSGYWGGNQTHAQKRLQELKKAGLSSIWFSVGAFHQEYVPYRSVHTAINAARAIGFDEIVVTGQFLGSVDSQNAFNSKTEEYIERLYLPEDSRTVRDSIVIEGRASEQLATYAKHKTVASKGECPMPLRGGGALEDPKKIEIDFLGNVTLCPGLCIGNTRSAPLSRIIQDYDFKQHPIIRSIAENGPRGLLEFPEMAGNVRLGEYVNECHMCYELRRQLRPHYPEFLAPEQCYKE
jgi:hypothetical protein